MPETYGAHECKVYYVQETTYGQTPSNPTMLQAPVDNIDAGIDPGLILVRGTGSRDLMQVSRGVRKPTLKLAHLLPVGAPIGLIQHAVSLNSLSVQVLYYKGSFASPTDVISLLYKGMRIDKLTVECNIEDPIKATVDMIGQDVATGTSKISGATYYDYSTGVMAYSDSFVQRGTAAGGSLTDVLRVTDWKFTIENNLKPVPVIRSSNAYLLKYLRERHRDLTGELTFEFEDKTEFDDVINDSQFSLKFGLGESKYALFTYCRWQNVSIPTKIEDLISLKAKFVAQGVSIT
jgi:hypothetical protein